MRVILDNKIFSYVFVLIAVKPDPLRLSAIRKRNYLISSRTQKTRRNTDER